MLRLVLIKHMVVVKKYDILDKEGLRLVLLVCFIPPGATSNWNNTLSARLWRIPTATSPYLVISFRTATEYPMVAASI